MEEMREWTEEDWKEFHEMFDDPEPRNLTEQEAAEEELNWISDHFDQWCTQFCE